jgi:hypothetical protein
MNASQPDKGPNPAQPVEVITTDLHSIDIFVDAVGGDTTVRPLRESLRRQIRPKYQRPGHSMPPKSSEGS